MLTKVVSLIYLIFLTNQIILIQTETNTDQQPLKTIQQDSADYYVINAPPLIFRNPVEAVRRGFQAIVSRIRPNVEDSNNEQSRNETNIRVRGPLGRVRQRIKRRKLTTTWAPQVMQNYAELTPIYLMSLQYPVNQVSSADPLSSMQAKKEVEEISSNAVNVTKSNARRQFFS